MDKTLKEILLEVMKARGVKVPALSTQTNIPKDRIYKWFQQGSTPSPEDSMILEKWIKKQNYVPTVNEENISYKEKYIKLLEQDNNHLKESIEINLITLRKYSEVLVAWVEAFAGSAPAHLSKNSEEAASWLQDIHKRLVDNLPPHAKGDISVGSLSKDKKLS
jgi:hypothetical protein